ncbi:HEPN domain-containing protein [Metallosphaera javensis (ex Sakai et al. 2022)]|uniref:HEPN domain-containing protein n=1 Tax=Metallosphaera javensis (ex Sakai et al. 2022) TaxID=2775498 RepID=UPI00258C0421|nr:MAG: DNA-binding protein [Metallosphaera javensis (ex Sakai et al. 2022)]
MSGLRVQRLKRRALQFLDDARKDLNDGFYDLAMFHSEEAIQLFLKAILLELFASEFRSHQVRTLLSYLVKLLTENNYTDLANEVQELATEHKETLSELEDAYIESRYGEIEYEKVQAENSISVSEKIINKLEEISKRVKLG